MDTVIDITDQVMEHLKRQPYEIICSCCGASLTCNVKIDNDFDLFLKVDPCEMCMREARFLAET